VRMQAMAHKDYSHRAIVDKLGIKSGHAVAFVSQAGQINETLRQQVLARTNRPPASTGEIVDIVLVMADNSTDIIAVLQQWRTHLAPDGGIWLLTPKRNQQGYMDQRELINAGLTAGLVDNKVCSVSDTTSAMRFVIRRIDRPRQR